MIANPRDKKVDNKSIVRFFFDQKSNEENVGSYLDTYNNTHAHTVH